MPRLASRVCSRCFNVHRAADVVSTSPRNRMLVSADKLPRNARPSGGQAAERMLQVVISRSFRSGLEKPINGVPAISPQRPFVPPWKGSLISFAARAAYPLRKDRKV